MALRSELAWLRLDLRLNYFLLGTPRVRSQNLRPALSCDPLPLHRRHFRHALPAGLLCLPVPLQQPHAMNGHRLEAIRYKTISRLTTIQKLTPLPPF